MAFEFFVKTLPDLRGILAFVGLYKWIDYICYRFRNCS